MGKIRSALRRTANAASRDDPWSPSELDEDAWSPDAASMDNRGQTNLTSLYMGLLVAGIVAIAVFIPVLNDVINSANLTGTTATIAGYLPLFGILLLLVAMVAPLMRRV